MVAAQQLLDWHAMMISRQLEFLIRASRVFPLSVLLQGQTTGQSTLLTGFAAIAHGVVKRSGAWDVEGLWVKVDQSGHCHSLTPLAAGYLGYVVGPAVDDGPRPSPPIPSSRHDATGQLGEPVGLYIHLSLVKFRDGGPGEMVSLVGRDVCAHDKLEVVSSSPVVDGLLVCEHRVFRCPHSPN